VSIVDKYLKAAGQDLQYLYSGAEQYGTAFIDDLAAEALKGNKKIVWEEDPAEDPHLGLLIYRLEDLSKVGA
jgi:hypothetical protein